MVSRLCVFLDVRPNMVFVQMMNHRGCRHMAFHGAWHGRETVHVLETPNLHKNANNSSKF